MRVKLRSSGYGVPIQVGVKSKYKGEKIKKETPIEPVYIRVGEVKDYLTKEEQENLVNNFKTLTLEEKKEYIKYFIKQRPISSFISVLIIFSPILIILYLLIF